MLGVGIPFERGSMLGIGMSLEMPGCGKIFSISGSRSLPTAGILGADVSFPGESSFPFLGNKAEPMDPRSERGRSFIVAELLAVKVTLLDLFKRGKSANMMREKCAKKTCYAKLSMTGDIGGMMKSEFAQ